MDSSIDRTQQTGPCIVCGLRNYPLSFGGPTICPACDCGNTGPELVRRQAERIRELEAKIATCPHDHQSGWVRGSVWEMTCDACGKKTYPLKNTDANSLIETVVAKEKP